MQLYIPEKNYAGKPVFYFEASQKENLDAMIYVEDNFHKIVNSIDTIRDFPAFIDIAPGWWNGRHSGLKIRGHTL